MTVTADFFFEHALTAKGWAQDVRISTAGGFIIGIEADVEAPKTGHRSRGIALPGLGNVHSHGFQRAMAGLAERASPAGDDFWAWREVMYRFLSILGPEEVEAITALAFMEMLENGFTSVAEFHYLHHDPQGRPYADPAELTRRIGAAAAMTGIGLTLLPVFYAHSGFGGASPASGQRRFISTLNSFAGLVQAAEQVTKDLRCGQIGIAPHSLRAVTPDELSTLVAMAWDRVIHIHAAEQQREVDDCLAALGARPVNWLLANMPVDRRWNLIHATHIDAAECAALARSGALAGLCPQTEGNLGDGIFPAIQFMKQDGRFGIGTDSNIAISAALELRALDYSQRLRDERRCSVADPDRSVGRTLFERAAEGAAGALDQPIGALAPGLRADFIVLDPDHPALMGCRSDTILDSWIFATTGSPIQDVFVAGEQVVAEGRHIARDQILRRWRDIAGRLRNAV